MTPAVGEGLRHCDPVRLADVVGLELPLVDVRRAVLVADLDEHLQDLVVQANVCVVLRPRERERLSEATKLRLGVVVANQDPVDGRDLLLQSREVVGTLAELRFEEAELDVRPLVGIQVGLHSHEERIGAPDPVQLAEQLLEPGGDPLVLRGPVRRALLVRYVLEPREVLLEALDLLHEPLPEL